MIHRDQWSFDRYQFPKGFEAEVATMWAVTDFTEEMGAHGWWWAATSGKTILTTWIPPCPAQRS